MAYYWHLKGPNGNYDAKDKLPVVAPEFSNSENSDVGVVGSGYAYFEAPSCLAKREIFSNKAVRPGHRPQNHLEVHHAGSSAP
jgi:hypothetical protein